ncbi:MAG: methylcobamide--CoM methyltransferase [Clostridiales Family XIII bacterium]|jgi:[methyl-Co(III) methanol-specific corrinoid protein]:coenzyme M methyltransferase|nr:methylcobamide--CoM methyltransferase [Clostridiales Family XIII bacterium]
MDDLSPKERISRAFDKKTVDRPPVVCPGGMMNAAIVEVMERGGNRLPEAHFSPELMAALSRDVREGTGFENYGVPFCMTVEAEVLGSEVDHGTLECEPKIRKERYADVSEAGGIDAAGALRRGRVAAVAEAVSRIAAKGGDVPVIGSVTGPISLAASLVDPMSFLKGLRKDSANAHRVLAAVTDFLVGYARLLAESGADAISIGDPTATGEILGPKMFEEYALRYINKLIDGIRVTGVPVIAHICGRLDSVKGYIPAIRAQAISADALVNLRLLKAEFPQLTTMGNLSTFTLEFGDPEKVARQTELLLRDGIDIIAPACGLSTSSSLDNIRALTGTVKGGA